MFDGLWVKRYVHGDDSFRRRVVDVKYNTRNQNTLCYLDTNSFVFWKGLTGPQEQLNLNINEK
jgi:hypothetical protein